MAAVNNTKIVNYSNITDVLQKICNIPSISGENRDKLHFHVDELNTFNFKKFNSDENEVICKLILHVIKIVPECDSSLAAKICQLISRFIKNQSIRTAVHATGHANNIVNWCMEVLSTKGELSIIDCMSTIEMLLRGRSVSGDPQALIKLLADDGSSSVVVWLNPEQLKTLKLVSAAEVELAALRVVKAIASPTEPGTGLPGGNFMPPARVKRLESCAAVFLAKISSPISDQDIHYHKKMTVCFKGMQAVILQRPLTLTLAQGLGIVQAFWLVGLPEYNPSCHPPTPAQPGPPPPAAPTSRYGPRKGRVGASGAKHNKRVRSALTKDAAEDEGGFSESSRGRRTEDELSSFLWRTGLSDSDDTSDNESSNNSRERQTVQSALRFAAVRLLLLLMKSSDPQTLMSFWDSLLPYTAPGSLPSNTPSLLCCLLRDPFVCSRTAAAQCIEEMLLRCQPFLCLAESNSSGSLAFTPWSQSLAQSLESCQRCLVLALSSERVAQCLVTTLGAMASLAAVTPYHRLPPGMLTRLARSARPQLYHKSLEVRAAALAVFCSLVSSTAGINHLAELKQLLQRPQPASLLGSLEHKPVPQVSDQDEEEIATIVFDDEDEEIAAFEDVSDVEVVIGRTWLIEYCVEALKSTEHTRRYRLEPCRVLAGFSRNNLELLLGEGGSVVVRTAKALAGTTLEEGDQNIQLTAGRALVDLGQAVGEYLHQAGGLSYLGAALEMWDELLCGTVPKLADSTIPTLRALTGDILAAVGPVVYENLPREQRLLIGFHLFALIRDPSMNVCTTAVRALGVSVNWPTVMEDGQFLLDAAEYVSGCLLSQDDWLQSRAAWALGNLGEALVANKEKGYPETVPESLLIKMLESTIIACSDEKLKAYAVRALGNLLRLLSTEQLKRTDCKNIMMRSVTALIDCASSPKCSIMKVRWNACHSLACLMKGKEFCEEKYLWEDQVFPMLCAIVVGSPNFKVRISAAVALAAPVQRSQYSVYFLSSWAALLDALCSADNVHDFREFQHRDNLVDQICLSLSHLTTLLTEDDLSGGRNGSLLQLVMAHESQLRLQLKKVRQRLVPERTEPINQAAEQITALSSKCCSQNAKDAAIYLMSVFCSEDVLDPVC